MATPENRNAGATSPTASETTSTRAYGDQQHVTHETAYASRGDVDERHRRDHHDQHDQQDVAAHRDMVRWGPLWAGVMVAVASYLVMQLAIFALDLFTQGGGGAGSWLSALAALVAFFLGGLTVGATALWPKVTHGLLNGAVMWAFATVALLVLALVGGGTLLGPISTVASDLVQIQELNLQNPPEGQVNEALQGAREAAGWALLGLGLSLAAAVAGGAAGAKIWPGHGTAEMERDADTAHRH